MNKEDIKIVLGILTIFILLGLSCIFLLWVGQKVLA